MLSRSNVLRLEKLRLRHEKRRFAMSREYALTLSTSFSRLLQTLHDRSRKTKPGRKSTYYFRNRESWLALTRGICYRATACAKENRYCLGALSLANPVAVVKWPFVLRELHLRSGFHSINEDIRRLEVKFGGYCFVR